MSAPNGSITLDARGSYWPDQHVLQRHGGNAAAQRLGIDAFGSVSWTCEQRPTPNATASASFQPCTSAVYSPADSNSTRLSVLLSSLQDGHSFRFTMSWRAFPSALLRRTVPWGWSDLVNTASVTTVIHKVPASLAAPALPCVVDVSVYPESNQGQPILVPWSQHGVLKLRARLLACASTGAVVATPLQPSLFALTWEGAVSLSAYDTGSAYLSVPVNVLPVARVLSFKLVVRHKVTGAATFGVVSIKINAPPEGGSCSVLPEQGTALRTGEQAEESGVTNQEQGNACPLYCVFGGCYCCLQVLPFAATTGVTPTVALRSHTHAMPLVHQPRQTRYSPPMRFCCARRLLSLLARSSSCKAPGLCGLSCRMRSARRQCELWALW